MENLNSIKYQPVTSLTKLNTPHKIFDNKDTYIKTTDPQDGKITIYKTIDPDRVAQKSGVTVTPNHYQQACDEANTQLRPVAIEAFPCKDTPAFAVVWHIDNTDTQTIHEFFFSGPGTHILDTLQDCLTALPSGWEYYDTPRPIR